MTDTHIDVPRKPLRLWPGVVAAALQWLGWVVVPAVVPQWTGYGMLAAALFTLAILFWWLFFSRAPWADRVGAIVLMVIAVAATSRLVHASIAGAMMGYMAIVYAIPVVTLALVVGAALSRGRSARARRLLITAAVAVACASLTVIRTNGMDGEGDFDLEWRWSADAEERLLAEARDDAPGAGRARPLEPARASTATAAPPAAPAREETRPSRDDRPPAAAPAGMKAAERGHEAETRSAPAGAAANSVPMTTPEWPGFRGSRRDSIVRGARIDSDWARSAPVELWRRPIGPGWSSFAVNGNLVYTQEQRGAEEIVSAYDLGTGAPVWRHRDAARFWEANAGAGPRGTPTLHNGRVYTLGATGILNALDARDGSVIWSRNAASDTGAKIPDWGFAGSPLITGGKVIVATGGVLAAYDLATGNPQWIGPKGGWGYASPHLATIDGVVQIVFLNGTGAIGVAPADGALLWTHEWRSDGILQPAFIDGDVLIGSGSGLAAMGTRRVAVARGPAGWTAQERWTSSALKPYFNDVVVHEGHAFGFDGSILACIDLATGERKWKGGRYGHGQLILLPDQDLLLVLSEEGELALVKSATDRFAEVARVPAIEGKTWNHPVLVRNILLVRNGEEMAAFRLALVGS